MISITTILIFVTFIAIAWVIFKNCREPNLPPGPISLPIVGNLLSFGTSPHKVFFKWAEKYGKIFTVSFGGYRMIVLNDVALIQEAFKEHNFSARPTEGGFTVLTDGTHGVGSSSGSEWVEQRTFTQRHLRSFGLGTHAMEDLIMEEVHAFITTLDADGFQRIPLGERFNLFVHNTLWKIISGHRFDPNDPKLKNIVKSVVNKRVKERKKAFAIPTSATSTLAGVSRCSLPSLPASIEFELQNVRAKSSTFFLFAVLFPRLSKKFPDLLGYNKIKQAINLQRQYSMESILKHQNNPPKDGVPKDFIDAYLKEINATTNPNSSFYKNNGITSLLAVVSDLFLAGSDTTSTSLSFLFLYLAKFQKIQKKIKIELREVIGINRPILLADRQNLPYLEAVILEALRYSSISSFGLPHRLTIDTDFHGYRIPKDTWVTANHFYVHFNNKNWRAPEVFNPDRFLEANGKSVKRSNINFIPFSLGKRKCFGETLARDEMFLFAANIVQRFNIKLADDSKHVPIEGRPGLMIEPYPYWVTLTEQL